MSFGPCADHKTTPPYDGVPLKKGERCDTCRRIAREGQVFRRTAKHLLKLGYELGVFDCEEITVRNSRDLKQLEEAAFTTDDDKLLVYRPGAPQHFGWVWFVYGNSGWDVIADYTINLETQLEPIIRWCMDKDD